MSKIEPKTLKGFRDFLPKEAVKRQYVIEKIRGVFELYGFEPLETPAIEYEEILLGKYGEEGDKLLYRFEDRGGRKVALRYDQTVPLARVSAQYQNELPLPFKRYQIQPVWRAENPQKGRFREFLQCDADIVGSTSPLSDAEVISVCAKALENLGFSKFKILINDRQLFSNLIKKEVLSGNTLQTAIRAMDKLKKIGREKVLDEMIANGISSEIATYAFQAIEQMEPSGNLKNIFDLLPKLGIESSQFEFSSTLARGLDYYTGLIFEIEIDGYSVGSVCGGGRYDNLIGMFSSNQLPAVGFAFGFDRLVEAMDELNLFPKDLGVTKVLVTVFSDELKGKSLEICSRLRENSINTEIYLGEIKDKNPLEKQLKYADQKQIPFVVIIGPSEIEKHVVILKNMKTREQKEVTVDPDLIGVDEMIKEIK